MAHMYYQSLREYRWIEVQKMAINSEILLTLPFN